MTDTNLLSRNRNDCWETPACIFDPLKEIFQFDLDAAASPGNAKCPLYLTEKDDSLTVDWYEFIVRHLGFIELPKVWTNPPYDFIYPWMVHGWNQSLRLISFKLLPPNIDNRWFIEYVAPDGLVDNDRVECWNYVGGLTQPPGWKERREGTNTSRIKFVDPEGGRVAPTKGNISVVYYPPGVEHKRLPPDQWRRMF